VAQFKVKKLSNALRSKISNPGSKINPDEIAGATCGGALHWAEFDQENKESNNKNHGPIHILAWTTTPWTLPSNTALAVGRDIEYVLVKTFNQYTFEPIN
ncbi:MAG TPA: class I tRNA ligase family protein, partial [Flavobacterium sp.]|nr:class I tRNA ligase family protein [Flavobacterium sp.]